MMALSAWMVWRERGFGGASAALGLFLLQLGANSLWSWLFFSRRLGAVAFAGVLVLWLGSSWPDLVAGALIAAVAFKGGIEILQSVREDRRSDG